jgi:hypothetical protein
MTGGTREGVNMGNIIIHVITCLSSVSILLINSSSLPLSLLLLHPLPNYLLRILFEELGRESIWKRREIVRRIMMRK